MVLMQESVPAESLFSGDIQSQGHIQPKRRLLNFISLNTSLYYIHSRKLRGLIFLQYQN